MRIIKIMKPLTIGVMVTALLTGSVFADVYDDSIDASRRLRDAARNINRSLDNTRDSHYDGRHDRDRHDRHGDRYDRDRHDRHGDRHGRHHRHASFCDRNHRRNASCNMNDIPINTSCTYALMADDNKIDSFTDSGKDYVWDKYKDDYVWKSTDACKIAKEACTKKLNEVKRDSKYKNFELTCTQSAWGSDPIKTESIVCGSKSNQLTHCKVTDDGILLKKTIDKVYLKQLGYFEDYLSYLTWEIDNFSKIDRKTEKERMQKVCGRQGQNWGVSTDKKSLWVKNGCKGVFNVVIKETFSMDNDDDSPIVIPGVNDGNNDNDNDDQSDDRQCNKPKLDNCLKYGGGNGCYTKWCN